MITVYNWNQQLYLTYKINHFWNTYIYIFFKSWKTGKQSEFLLYKIQILRIDLILLKARLSDSEYICNREKEVHMMPILWIFLCE